MNEKEFSYFALNHRDKWAAGFGQSTRVTPEGYLSLWPGERVASADEIRRTSGFAVDGRGNLFIIDAPNCRIYQYLTGCQQFHALRCIGGCGSLPGQFRFSSKAEQRHLGWLALGQHTLYVSDTLNHRVQAFYLPGYQLRFILGVGELDHPKDLQVDRRGRLYVLDEGHRQIVRYNRHGEFDGIWGEAYLKQPQNIALDAEDNLYVLDSAGMCVLKLSPQGELLGILVERFTAIKADFQPAGLAVDDRQMIYVGEKGVGEDLHIYIFDPEGEYRGRFGQYDGECYQLQAVAGKLYTNWGKRGEIVLLNGEGGFLAEGIYYAPRFDSQQGKTPWHRLVMDGELPANTKVQIYCYAADQQETTGGTPIDGQYIDAHNEWRPVLSSPRNNLPTQDALFDDVQGRYLWLKIRLFGDEAQTPLIRRLTVYLPRISYLRYLPATYQEDKTGKSILERYLSLFESLSFDLEQVIARVPAYFDARATPAEFLNWLGGWLAIARDDNWPEAKQRELLDNIFPLYQQRGTIEGLKALVKLYCGREPLIIEHFQQYQPLVLAANAVVGRSTVVGRPRTKPLILETSSRIGEFRLVENPGSAEEPFTAEAFYFTIMVNTTRLENAQQLASLRRIIESEKPAHTHCRIITSGGEMQLGVHAFLEVDTILSRGYRPMRLGTHAIIGRQTYVSSKYRYEGAIEARSRIGIDTVLN
ncbi:MAG: hypothetical protein KDI38_01520 [Calditrichaeota bacterium]|nr:hypothetical protein [Calditrichota bacterium]MCB0312301.1 hypothetical protein [Calditrichota bacterium]